MSANAALLVAVIVCVGSALFVALTVWRASRRTDPRAAERIDRLEVENARLERDLAGANATLKERSANLAEARSEAAGNLQAFATARDENTGLRVDLSRKETQIAEQKKQADEKIRLLTDARDALTQQFKVLASEILERHGNTFAKQNMEQIAIVLQPLRDKLVEFQQGLRNAHTDSAKERAVLGEQIAKLTETSAKMTSETTTLADALRGNSQTQGAWGEMILASILERSGLRAGEEYSTQETFITEDGAKQRPDVIVRLPGGQRVVIDSKVSLVAFEAMGAANTEEERQHCLSGHCQSLEAHIQGLSRKEYHAVAGGGLDYVVMFVPIEGALAAALRRNPGLTAFAVERNVAIATPTTLMIALRTVESVWKIERRNANAEAIAERAGKMYDKFVNFIGEFSGIGKSLDQAQLAHRKAMDRLSTGSGNLAGQFEKLKELGARTTKVIPAAILGNDQEKE